MIDDYLAVSLRLATALRDAAPATRWRTAWNVLGAALPGALPPPSAEFAERLRERRRQGPFLARPLIFPLLFSRSIRRNDTHTLAALQASPTLWSAYRDLREGVRLLQQIFGYLWSIFPGASTHELIYTRPDTPWRDPYNNLCKVPFGPNAFTGPATTGPPGFGRVEWERGLDPPVRMALDDLVAAIRGVPRWEQLVRTHREITQHPQLVQDLAAGRYRFEQALAALHQESASADEMTRGVLRLGISLYSESAPPIRTYVALFKSYEALLANIYWLISQVVIHQTISCLSSAVPAQVQQVTLYPGVPFEQAVFVTALAPTHARTLQIGQLVHLTLAETDQALDGVYQVECWHLTAAPGQPARLFFRARHLWHLAAEALPRTPEDLGAGIFVPSEMRAIAEILPQMRALAPNGEDGDLLGPNPKLDQMRVMHF